MRNIFAAFLFSIAFFSFSGCDSSGENQVMPPPSEEEEARINEVEMENERLMEDPSER